MDLAGLVTSDGQSAASVVWLAVLVAVAAALVALFVAGVVSVLRAPRLGTGARAVWLVAMLVFPLLGPLAWFLVGRRSSAAVSRPSRV